jgi:cyclic pyranopterin phosphate synthase
LLSACNLNCAYCRPPGSEKSVKSDDNHQNFTAAISLLHDVGACKFRFTGGEPTLYKRLDDLVSHVKELSEENQIAITTNGVILADMAEKLAAVGLDSVNISLDTLSRPKFTSLTGCDRLLDVQRGIVAAVQQIPTVKLNSVMIRGTNDDEAKALIEYANELQIPIRFIEYMPTRHYSANREKYISGDELMSRLPYRFLPAQPDGSSAAKYYESPDLDIKVGFINPVSHSFCTECDRLRLASDGRLYSCLFSSQSTNLFAALSEGPEIAKRELSRLVDSKQFVGCSASGRTSSEPPSFTFIGG